MSSDSVLHRRSNRNIYVVTVVAMSLFALGSWLRLRASYGLGFDLGFYLQQVWLLRHGVTHGSLANLPVFSDHLSPILYLFAPLGDSAYLATVLVVAQAIAVGATIWPLVVRRSLGRGWPRVAVALYFLLSPALGYAVLFDFHPMLLGLPILAWILNLLERDKSDGAVACLVIASLAIREDVAVLAGMLVLVYGVRRTDYTRAKIAALIVILVAGGYVLLSSANLGRFADNPVHQRFSWITDVIHGDLASLQTTFSSYVVVTAIVVYFPILLLPALARRGTTILALLVSLFFIAGDFVPADSIYYQYEAVPVLLMAWSIGGAVGPGSDSTRIRSIGMVGLLFAVMFGPLSVIPPPTPVTDRWMPNVIQDQDRAVLSRIREVVPPQASVSASNTVGPFLAQREYIYDFPDPLSCKGVFTPSRGSTSYPDFVVVTDLETDASDIAMVEGFGYLPVDRVYDATVYRAPASIPPVRDCIDRPVGGEASR